MKYSLIPFATSLALLFGSAQAIAGEAEIIESMGEDTWFKGSASYPDELSHALTPLLHCELRLAGSRVTMGGRQLEGADTRSECDELRQRAAIMVAAALDEAGVMDEKARAQITKRAFGAVDALAASQRIWREANQ